MEREHRRSRVRNSSYRRNYNNAYYNPSSVAYKYDFERQYYEPRRKQNIEKKKQLKKNKIQTVNEATGHSLRVYVTVFMLFGFALYFIFTNASFIEKRSQIADLKAELKQIEEENTYMETELTKNLDLKEVEKQAAIKLGMQKPAAHQVVYIDVPQQSYLVKCEEQPTLEEENGFFKNIKNVLRID